MTGDGRMETTIKALLLFLQSLPVGCSFNIISFGDNFKPLERGLVDHLEYSDETLDYAKE
jgi:hypothetical protein